MRVSQHRWRPGGGWDAQLPDRDGDADLVLAFGAPACLEDDAALASLRSAFPAARVVGCSTSGEIAGTAVEQESLVATAIRLERSRVDTASVSLGEVAGDSFVAGRLLMDGLLADDLRHVLVFSDGLAVNGSRLAEGLVSRLPDGVHVSGGLAGDGPRFGRTLVIDGGRALPERIAAVGLYGDGLSVGAGSDGGWDAFGADRVVTEVRGNVLYTLDGESALGLYRTYLGPHAEHLPSSGLRFPLMVRASEGDPPIVRTLLAVDERAGTMTFAGDLPRGGLARLMRANLDRLVEGAERATGHASARAAARHGHIGRPPDLVLLVSCVGRLMVLGQRTDEEIEAVSDGFGGGTMAGFYSYGELAPVRESPCALHNQTMTVTAIWED